MLLALNRRQNGAAFTLLQWCNIMLPSWNEPRISAECRHASISAAVSLLFVMYCTVFNNVILFCATSNHFSKSKRSTCAPIIYYCYTFCGRFCHSLLCPNFPPNCTGCLTAHFHPQLYKLVLHCKLLHRVLQQACGNAGLECRLIY